MSLLTVSRKILWMIDPKYTLLTLLDHQEIGDLIKISREK